MIKPEIKLEDLDGSEALQSILDAERATGSLFGFDDYDEYYIFSPKYLWLTKYKFIRFLIKPFKKKHKLRKSYSNHYYE